MPTHLNRHRRSISQHCPFWIKTHNKLEVEGNFLNLIKNGYEKLPNSICNGERLHAFPLRSDIHSYYFYSALCWRFWSGQLGKKSK